MSAAGVEAAIDYHRAHESAWRRDFLTDRGRYVGVADEPEGPDDVLGPVRPRGGPNGVLLRAGVVVAEWGDTSRVDMTFSVAKSYLAALAGVAVGRGLIGSLDDPVRAAKSTMNFLWTTFTRFEPAADIHAASSRVVRNHIVRSGPIVVDARMKPWYPKELSCRDDVAAKVTARWREYFPSRNVEMGDSEKAHLD